MQCKSIKASAKCINVNVKTRATVFPAIKFIHSTLQILRAVVKSTFVESKTSPSPKRFESESSPSPKRFESESSPSPKRFESKSK